MTGENQSPIPGPSSVSGISRAVGDESWIAGNHPEPARTLVAMPAYNEEQYIAKTIVGARRSADRVLVVDDGSTDDTVPIAQALGALVIQHGTNKGYGQALQTIFATARELGAEELVIIDSDGQHNPEDIPKLLDELRKGSDVVLPDTNIQSDFGAYGKKAIEAIHPSGEVTNAGSNIQTMIRDHHLSVAEMRSESPTTTGDPRYRGKRIAVVIPAYNEELLIGETLQGIPQFVDRIYAIDDCSQDNTLSIAREHAARDSRITVIHHEKNAGVGAAIVTGYKAALADGVDIAAVMAGDNQMDPAFLPHLLDPVVTGEADYSMGNRLVDRDFRSGMSKFRFFGNALLTLLTKIASGYWQMVDPQNGYTAISKRALTTISLNDIYPGYGYCNNILVSLNVYGFRVKNVPHPARYGRDVSGIRYRTYIFRLSRLLLKDFLWRLKMKYIVLGFHPLVFYYFFGVIITIMSVLAGFWTLYYKFGQGGAMFVPAVVTLLLFSIGAQFILFAMLFDMQMERNGGWY